MNTYSIKLWDQCQILKLFFCCCCCCFSVLNAVYITSSSVAQMPRADSLISLLTRFVLLRIVAIVARNLLSNTSFFNFTFLLPFIFNIILNYFQMYSIGRGQTIMYFIKCSSLYFQYPPGTVRSYYSIDYILCVVPYIP